MCPGISVIVCAFDNRRWDALSEAMTALQHQTRPALEVIVVVDHNEELLSRVEASWPQVRVLANSGANGAGSARNAGVDVARGEILAFLDDDAEPFPDWLAEIAQAHEGGHILGVGGGIEPRWEESRPGWFPDEFLWVVGCDYRGLPQAQAEIRNTIAANMSVERQAFADAGGFRAGFGKVGASSGADETELCIRMGAANPGRPWIRWPAARVRHRVPARRCTLRYFVVRCYQEGKVKAALTSLAGAQAGLASEREYASRILPGGFARNAWQGLTRLDRSAIGRAGAIALGLLAPGLGFLEGSIRARFANARPADR